MRKKSKRKKSTALSEQRQDPIWRALDAEIGGREGLLELAKDFKHPSAPILAELCLDPAFRRCKTKELARKAGIGTEELHEMFRNKRWMEASIAIHNRLPTIAEGAAVDASPSMVPCEACKGSGMDEKGAQCWVCGGKGEVRKPGDTEKLKFVGEAVGMTGKKGPAVQINQQFNQQTAQPDSFEGLMRRAVVKIERKQIQEAEVVPGNEESH